MASPGGFSTFLPSLGAAAFCSLLPHPAQLVSHLGNSGSPRHVFPSLLALEQLGVEKIPWLGCGCREPRGRAARQPVSHSRGQSSGRAAFPTCLPARLRSQPARLQGAARLALPVAPCAPKTRTWPWREPERKGLSSKELPGRCNMRLKYLIASNKGEHDAAASLRSISCWAQGPAGTVWSHGKSEASPSDLGSGALRHLLVPNPAAPQAQPEPVPEQAPLLSPSPGHAPLGAPVRAQLGAHRLRDTRAQSPLVPGAGRKGLAGVPSHPVPVRSGLCRDMVCVWEAPPVLHPVAVGEARGSSAVLL